MNTRVVKIILPLVPLVAVFVMSAGCHAPEAGPTAHRDASVETWLDSGDVWVGEPSDIAPGVDTGGERLDVPQVADSAMDGQVQMDRFAAPRDSGIEREEVATDVGFFMEHARQIMASPDEVLTCAVVMNGDVYCWGFNPDFNPAMPREEAYRPRRLAGFRNVVQVEFSDFKLCAVDQGSNVWCMGTNIDNSLATGSSSPILSVPGRRLDVSNVTRIAWSGHLLLAVSNGTLFARDHLRPYVPPYTFTFPARVVDVSGNLFSFCATLLDGSVVCRGRYISDVTPWEFSEGPRRVNGLTDVASVAVGLGFYCALKRDGTVWCWGDNLFGQTGTPIAMAERCFQRREEGAEVYASCVRQPRQIAGLANVVEVRAGLTWACARLRDGSVWCWGYNPPFLDMPLEVEGGLLGDGMPPTELCPSEPWIPASRTPAPVPCRQRPVRVVGVSDATALSVGNFYSCAAIASGQIRCWGDNTNGRLGDGTTIHRPTAVPVVAPR